MRFLADNQAENPFVLGRRPVALSGSLVFLCLAASSLVHAQQRPQSNQSAIPQDTFSSLLHSKHGDQATWLFLGDSNTFSGGYVGLIDAWLAQLPNSPRVLNLGMPSETASGLSEKDHPFKRPCIHERIDKVLQLVAPDVVFVSYGMNDGIYQPPSTENLAAFQDGMQNVADKIHAAGASLVIMTPPIFEPEPVKASDKLGPTDQGRYAYFAPAADYDRVLEQQTEWLKRNPLKATAVVDIHAMLHSEKAQARESDDSFCFSQDGVHYGPVAHALVAEELLRSLGAPRQLIGLYPDELSTQQAMRIMQKRRDAYLSATGKNRPGLSAGLPVWHVENWVKKVRLQSASVSP